MLQTPGTTAPSAAARAHDVRSFGMPMALARSTVFGGVEATGVKSAGVEYVRVIDAPTDKARVSGDLLIAKQFRVPFSLRERSP